MNESEKFRPIDYLSKDEKFILMKQWRIGKAKTRDEVEYYEKVPDMLMKCAFME